MFQKQLILLVAALLRYGAKVAGDCVADTSEGTRTLLNGETACHSLAAGETEGDKGRRYVTCSNGILYIQPCGSSLRYDIVSKTCTWPESATCSLAGGVTTADTTQKIPVSSQSPATNKPTTSSNSTRESSTQLYTTLATRKSSTQLYTTLTTRESSTHQPGSCNQDTCKPPDCFCFGERPNIPLADTPMFLMLSFDDAVTSTVYNGYFKSLLVDNKFQLRNPSGCPIRATFYVNHEYTDYNYVKALANTGHEIASHTVSHRLPPGDSSADYLQTVAEINGMREKVFQGTGDKAISDSMGGFRAPYLLVTQDMFDALRDSGFLYDTSITNVEIYSGRPPLYPFTLDYVMPRCPNVPCPTKSYPGLWEVPINGLMGSNNYSCSMIDTCSVGSNVFTANEEEWTSFYETNFKYFYGPKVPMQLFTHGSMFIRSPPSFDALVKWFQRLQATHKDVWIVTPKMVIEWMKKPISYSDMIAQKWGCD